MLFTVVFIYFLSVVLTIYCVFLMRKLSNSVRLHKESIDNLDKELYKDLRLVQYKAMDISAQAKKYTKNKNAIYGEIVTTLALALLPFKKLKGIIYLHKLGRKFCTHK